MDIFEKVEFCLDDSIRSSSNPDSISNPVLLKIKVEEKSSVVLKAGTFLESKSTAAGFDASFGLRNPLGSGEKVFFEGAYGRDKSNKFSLNWMKPYFYGYPATFNFLLNNETTNFMDTSSYDESNKEVEFRLTSKGKTSLSYILNLRDIVPKVKDFQRYSLFSPKGNHFENAEVQYDCSEEILLQAIPSLKSCLKLTTQQIMGSTRLKTQVEYAGLGIGGDTDMLKGFFETQSIQKLEDFSSIAVFTLRCGLLLPLGKTKESHIADRFFLGGPLNLRGFRLRGAGPHSKHYTSTDVDALGGDTMWSCGLSMISQLPVQTLDNVGLQAICFLNAGNVAKTGSSLKDLLLGLRSSCGIGLVLPFQSGRIELTYSYILKNSSWDNTQRLQLGVGIDFL